jgi:hypothetical protein
MPHPTPDDPPADWDDALGAMLRDYLHLGDVRHTNEGGDRQPQKWPRLAGGYPPARTPHVWLQPAGPVRFPTAEGGRRWR